MVPVLRPNRDALDKAIGIYHDCLREFIIRALKLDPSQDINDAMRHALRGRRLEDFEEQLGKGEMVEEFLDVQDIPHVIAAHWDSVFGGLFNKNKDIFNHCHDAKRGRDKAYHRATRDLGTPEAISHLYHISEALRLIVCTYGQGQVDQISNGILNPSMNDDQPKRPRASRGRTTVPGYVNQNNQKNLGRTNPPRPGNDYAQSVYVLRCLNCQRNYGANGSDIHIRRCPFCQDGAGGLALEGEELGWE